MSSRPISARIHHFPRTVMLKASDAGSSGLSAISAAKKNTNSAPPKNRNLMRFQNDCGFRVGRSLSRGRLSNSVAT